MLTDIGRWREAARAHGEFFGDFAPPAPSSALRDSSIRNGWSKSRSTAFVPTDSPPRPSPSGPPAEVGQRRGRAPAARTFCLASRESGRVCLHRFQERPKWKNEETGIGQAAIADKDGAFSVSAATRSIRESLEANPPVFAEDDPRRDAEEDRQDQRRSGETRRGETGKEIVPPARTPRRPASPPASGSPAAGQAIRRVEDGAELSHYG